MTTKKYCKACGNTTPHKKVSKNDFVCVPCSELVQQVFEDNQGQAQNSSEWDTSS